MTSEEIMGENKSFWQVVVDCLKNLLIKAISFKNIGFGIGKDDETVLDFTLEAE